MAASRWVPLAEVPELSGAGKGVYLMRPGGEDDRIVGALAPGKGADVIVVTVEGNERKLAVEETVAGGEHHGTGAI